MTSFLDVALNLVARGFHVLPLVPGDKRPILKGGYGNSTTNRKQAALWWEMHPDANIGIDCEATNLCVMDADHGLTCLEDFIAWRDRNGLPPTYTIRSGRRVTADGQPEFGAQMYYRRMMDTHGHKTWMLDGCTGDFKSKGGLVVHPPSIHPDSGERYEVLLDLPLVDRPEFVLSLPEVPKKGSTKTPGSADGDGLIEGNRNDDMVQFIGKIRRMTHGMDRDTCLVACLHRNERYAKGPMPESEVIETLDKQFRQYPSVGPDPVVTIGGSKDVVDVEEVEELDQALRAVPLPAYPLEVFEGTLYMEFAKRAAAGNFVPPEFFIEGAMTYVGAMAADNLRGFSDEITPRMYTVLLANAGIGKGTTFRRLRKLAPPHRMLDAVTDSNVPHTAASAALLARAGSEPALNDALLAWKCVCLDFEEMDRMLEKTEIQGSGSALMSVIRTLFDDIVPGITTTGERTVVAPIGYLSLLGAMTPSLWRRAMEGRDSYGSGLGGRFNLVATNVNEATSALHPMDVGDLQSTLDRKLAELEQDTLTIAPERAALDVLAEWWMQSKGQPHYNRVNVILHRKALHLAWLRGEPVITKEIMLQALMLGDYLVSVRDAFAVTKGEDRTAIGENRVMHILKQISPKAVSSKKVVELLDGLMSRASVFRALESLTNSGEVEKHTVKQPGNRRYDIYRVSLT